MVNRGQVWRDKGKVRSYQVLGGNRGGLFWTKGHGRRTGVWGCGGEWQWACCCRGREGSSSFFLKARHKFPLWKNVLPFGNSSYLPSSSWSCRCGRGHVRESAAFRPPRLHFKWDCLYFHNSKKYFLMNYIILNAFFKKAAWGFVYFLFYSFVLLFQSFRKMEERIFRAKAFPRLGRNPVRPSS